MDLIPKTTAFLKPFLCAQHQAPCLRSFSSPQSSCREVFSYPFMGRCKAHAKVETDSMRGLPKAAVRQCCGPEILSSLIPKSLLVITLLDSLSPRKCQLCFSSVPLPCPLPSLPRLREGKALGSSGSCSFCHPTWPTPY